MKTQARFRVKRVSYTESGERTLTLDPIDEFEGWEGDPEAMDDAEWDRRHAERCGFDLSSLEITVEAPVEPGAVLTLTLSVDG